MKERLAKRMNVMVGIVAGLLGLIVPMQVGAATIYVPDDTYLIQDAIDIAVDGDIVIVGPGTHMENINFLGKKITVVSWGGPQVTTIDGGRVSSVVTFNTYEDTTSVLDGFTITNGSGLDSTWGGGIFCGMAFSLIKNNIIENNQALEGGGIYYGTSTSLLSPLSIQNNIIRDNSAFGTGGGIFCGTDSSIITNNIIENNVSDGRGGGIYVGFHAYNSMITNNIISHNSSGSKGGGVFVKETTPLIINNMIFENAADLGAGIYVEYTTDVPAITNNTMTLNSAAVEGGGIFFETSTPNSSPVTNTIISP